MVGIDAWTLDRAGLDIRADSPQSSAIDLPGGV
jgi:hypothetical protein